MLRFESTHWGSIRPFLFALAALSGVLGALPPSDFSFTYPTNSASNGTSIFVNVSFTSDDPDNCTLVATAPDGTASNYSMNRNGSSCLYELAGVSLGNYTYFVVVTDHDLEEGASPANWTVGQYCDAELTSNLTLAADLEANLETTNYCFQMSAQNSTLDCAGHSITLSSGSGEAAVRMGGSNTGVENCVFLGGWTNAYVHISDYVGNNQSDFRVINNSFSPTNSPEWGDIAVNFGSAEYSNYTRIEANEIHHGVVISGNIVNLDFIGNLLDNAFPTSTQPGGQPDGLLYGEQGNGEGVAHYWLVQGNVFEAGGLSTACVSTGNSLEGMYLTEYINNNCSGDDEVGQILNGIGNFTIINSTFDPYDKSLWQARSPDSFTRLGWYSYLNATNESGSGLESVNVTYFDSNGGQQGSLLTDASGFGRFTILESVIDRFNAESLQSPHFFTALKDGYVNASANVTVNRSIWVDFVLMDSTAPQNISFTFPSTIGNVSQNWISANVTFEEASPHACLFQLDSVDNYAMSRTGTNCFFNSTGLAEGAHNYSVIVNDTGGLANYSEMRCVLIDTTPPTNFTFISPSISGRTYNAWFSVNASFNETHPSSCILNVNDSANYSMDLAGLSAYLLLAGLANGTYAYAVICNDTSGNTNSSGVRIVTVNTTIEALPTASGPVTGSSPGQADEVPFAKEGVSPSPAVASVFPKLQVIPISDGKEPAAPGVPEALFDIVVQVLEKNLAPGGIPAAKISLTKFNAAGKISVDILYEIRDGTGKAIRVARETRIVELTEDFIVSLGLPDGAPSGKYELYAKITYGGGKVAESSDTFEYSHGEPTGKGAGPIPGFIPYLLGILAATSFLYFWQWKDVGGEKREALPDDCPITVKRLVRKRGSQAIREYTLK